MLHDKMKNIVYQILEEDVQNEAQIVLGRTLNDDEMLVVTDALSDGIGETIGIIYNTILTEVLPVRLKINTDVASQK